LTWAKIGLFVAAPMMVEPLGGVVGLGVDMNGRIAMGS